MAKAKRRGEARGPNWVWELTDVARSGSSGDLAKLFKNEGVKNPGVLAQNAPAPEATLLARECLQNSWDAARELRSELGDGAPAFQVSFEFGELSGASKGGFAAELDLGGLRAQYERLPGDPGKVLGLEDPSCLDDLNDLSRGLSFLRIVEQGTTGMYGPFVGAKSKLYLGLVSIGFTKKGSGAGGSYGYGKAGLISASATRTVIAYTCFRERKDDPRVTRRLLGMTYWGQHDFSDASYTGFARFGHQVEGAVIPFENDQADEVAASLGMTLRSPDQPADLGTTFLLLQPTVEPEDLARAVARNWWPALEDNLFHVEVRQLNTEGESVDKWVPRPRKDNALQGFIRAYELATVPQDNSVDHEWSRTLAKTNVGSGQLDTGQLGLVADLDGWSYDRPEVEDDEDTQVRHRSLVALIRGPRMVVEYLEAGRQPPFVRGAFVAADDVDDFLRQTEPKAHDAWLHTDLEDDADHRAGVVAKAVLRKVRAGVLDFRRRLRPPPARSGDVRLPVFQDLARRIMKATSAVGDPPQSAPRAISVQLAHRLEAVDDENIVLRGEVSFSLSDNYTAGEVAPVEGEIRYRFVEDARVGADCPLEYDWPDGFAGHDDGRFVGPLGRKRVTVAFASHPYPADWTARLTSACDVVSPLDVQDEEVEDER